MHILFITLLSFIYSFEINGFISDSKTNHPIIGVNVYLEDLRVGSSSDADGFFKFDSLNSGEYKLRFSHIGYDDYYIKLKVDSDTKLNISLRETFFLMDEIVTTGTRTDKIHQDTPIATEVISKKEIISSGATTLQEFLMQRSSISQISSVDGSGDLQILGMNSQHILILVNGQPITGKFNNRVSFDQISVNGIDRIELLKGPTSSLYGTEAMGGVINIIYKDVDSNLFTSSFKYRFANKSEQNNIEGYVSIAKKWSKSHMFSNIYIKSINNNKSVEDIDINTIDERGFSSIYTYNLSDQNSINTRIEYYNQDNTTKTLFGGLSSSNEKKVSRVSTILNHTYLLDIKNTIKQSVLYNVYSKKYGHKDFSGEEGQDLTEESYLKYEFNLVRSLENSIINIGVESSLSNYLSDRVDGEEDVGLSSIYFQYDSDIINDLNVIMGSRLDYYSDDMFVNSPRLGIMYHPGNRWKFRFTIGKGFRNPTFMEKYIDWYHEDFNYTVKGNPELKAESSLGLYGGVEYYHPTFYQMSLSFYRNYFNNLIDDYTIEPGLLSYTNFDEAIFSGVEILGRWRISEHYSYSWGMNFMSNKDGNGNILPNTQPVVTTSRLNYQNNKNSLNVSFYYKWIGSYTPMQYNPMSGQYIEGDRIYAYAISNIKFMYKPLKKVECSLSIENLGDYIDSIYGPFIGRQFTTNLMISI